MKSIWLVIPCYNEQEVLSETSSQLKNIMLSMMERGKISKKSKIAFVNDGSKDSTWDIISELCDADSIFAGINLSRNRGHQNALLAGLMTAKEHADAVISLDADLQDDVDVIEKMVDNFLSGDDVVYGVRSSRKTDTFFKRFTAESFYKFMKIMGVDIVYNHADYRLMSKRALEGLSEFSEVNLFLRGIVPQIGYKSSTVEYERKERFAGESKYPLKKMLSFAFEGITSFSVRPLKVATALGIVALLVSVAMLIYCLISKITGHAVAGWASIGASVWAIGGMQLFMLGVIGEYIGKIYLETKGRPKYIIESVKLNEEETE
ncbi:MAG: glycosyltransferase family 2 protein [Clostridia bacterium]|nr:glycosyltransferase family 2 protein [Clostridia bacterium]